VISLVPIAWVWVFVVLGVMCGVAHALDRRIQKMDETAPPLVKGLCGIVVFVLVMAFLGWRYCEPRTVDLSTKAYAHQGRTLECPRCQGEHRIRQDWDVTPDAAWAKYAVQCRWCGYQIKGGEEAPRGKDGVPMWTVIVGFVAGLAGGACLSFLTRLWKIGKALVKGGAKLMSMLETAADEDAKKS